MTRVRRTDVSTPLEVDDGGDLVGVDGNDLVRQRVERALTTQPGEIVHRPDWGAGLSDFQSEPPTETMKRRAANRATRTLKSLEYVEDFEVSVSETPGGLIRLGVEVVSDGDNIELPDIEL